MPHCQPPRSNHTAPYGAEHKREITVIRAKHVLFGASVMLASSAYAGFGGMGSIEASDTGSVDSGILLRMIIGAAIGYFVEQAYNKAQMRKRGDTPPFSDAGGVAGAMIGAFVFPMLIAIFS